VDKCHHEFVRHTQRLHKADKQSLDTVATQAEAALADAQLAHRQSIMAMDKARADHAPRLQEHVDSTAGEIVAALADALATVDRIATALSAVAQTVERDGGSLPPVLRSAYSARAMCRHVAGMIKI
jgi:ABC-type transporter Mla subunit MlaD